MGAYKKQLVQVLFVTSSSFTKMAIFLLLVIATLGFASTASAKCQWSPPYAWLCPGWHYGDAGPECIPPYYRCDGFPNDCMDNADEQNCDGGDDCGDTHWNCGNNQCIP